jgi:glycosyltransferase involved in cell wall biosynthesis
MSISSTQERVLVLTRLAPWTQHGGARIRNHWMIKGLASRYAVDLVVADDASGAPAEYHEMLASVSGFPRVTGARGWASRIADAVLTARPLYSAGIASDALKDHVAALLKQHAYIAIHADLNIEAAIPSHTTVPIVYNAHNCETALQRRHAAGEPLPVATALRIDANRLAGLERRFMERSSLITACSTDDVEDLAQLSPFARERSVLIPNGVDISRYESIGVDTFTQDSLLISGSMDWRPNQQGLIWFLDEVLPILRERAPQTAVRVAGRMSADFAEKVDGHDGVTAVPNPIDMREELERAHIIMAPITASSGTRLRILEAWAAGRPVVTTTFGALGLQYTDGQELLTRDEPTTFVDGIIELLHSRERWTSIRESAKARVAQYDWHPICDKLLESYAERLPKVDASES